MKRVKKKEFWQKELQDIGVSLLPVNQKKKLEENRQPLVELLADDLYKKILTCSQQKEITIETPFLIALSLFLSVYTNSNDIIFGLGNPNIYAQKEYLLNILPFRLYIDETSNITGYFQIVCEKSKQILAWVDTSFSEIQEIMGWSCNPLQIVVSVQWKNDRFQQNVGNLYPLYLVIQCSEENCQLIFNYDKNLFAESFIKEMFGYLQNILQGIVDDQTQPLTNIPLIDKTQEEYQRLISWGAPNQGFDYPRNETFIAFFREILKQHADNVAIVFGKEVLTYNQLDRLSDRLAFQLQNRGIKSGQVIAFCVERSLDMVIGLIGIQKTGASYLPILPDYPKERVLYMLKDSGASLFLTQRKFVNGLLDLKKEIDINLTIMDDVLAEVEYPEPYKFTQPLLTNGVYIRYTSGSAGLPKGVFVTHESLWHYLYSIYEEVYLDEKDVFLAVTPFSFDMSDVEIYLPLMRGARIVIASEEDVRNGEKILELITDHEISAMRGTPTMWQMLVTLGWSNRNRMKVLCAGEELHWEVAEKMIPFYHFYGPTEATIDATGMKIEKVDRKSTYVPIGRRLGKTSLYVLKHGHIIPEGAIGELFIGGPGVARYIDPGMTTECFIPNPLDHNERVYKTGDLVRWSNGEEKGILEFIGREDQQVKIRGNRIELGEIVARLLQHEAIEQSVIIVKEIEEYKYLIAFIKLKEGWIAVSLEEVRSFLIRTLPIYMVPSIFSIVDRFPITRHNKIDKEKLSTVSIRRLKSGKICLGPSSSKEEDLLYIFRDVFPPEIKDGISVNDSFFNELGGDSVRAIRVILRVNKQFQVQLNIGDLFEAPTVQLLARKLQNIQPIVSPDLLEIKDYNSIPLSFPQRGLWFLTQMEGTTVPYNLPFLFKIEGNLNVEALRQAFLKLIERHTVLRTVFFIRASEPRQRVVPMKEVIFDFSIINFLDRDEKEINQYIQEETGKPFDLEKDIPIWVKILKQSENTFFLLYCIHHIAMDGPSEKMIYLELSVLYASYCFGSSSSFGLLPSLSNQYADFAIRQRNSSLDLTGLKYWNNMLEGLGHTALTTDFIEPINRTHRGAEISFGIDVQVTERLRKVSRQNEVTLFVSCLAGFVTLLFRYIQEQDIIVGTSVSGRNQYLGLEDLIGFFVNVLVVRTKITPGINFQTLLKQLKQVIIEAYKNEVPFDELIKDLQPKRRGNIPLIKIAFIMEDPEDVSLQFDQLKVSRKNLVTNFSRLDIEVHMKETINGLEGCIIYSTELFRRETIERFGQHFKNILSIFSEKPTMCISHFSFLTEFEKELMRRRNRTDEKFSKNTIQELFERIVEEKQNQVALLFEEKALTYRELNEKANKIACFLRFKEQVRKEDIIAVFMDRGIDLIISILGILKSGARCVLVDTTYPTERIRNIFDFCECRLILTQQIFHTKLLRDNLSYQYINVEEINDNKGFPEMANPLCINRPDDIVYVVFTSGTTKGKPKGVMLRHHGIINLTQAEIKDFRINENSRILQNSSPGFDGILGEIYPAFLSGATLCLAKKENLFPGYPIIETLQRYNITHVTLSPTMLTAMPWVNIPSLEFLISVGEVCSVHLVEKWCKGNLKFVNGYGPTENSIGSSWRIYDPKEVESGSIMISIGQLISGVHGGVFDEDNNEVPINIVGELCLSGKGLMAGYLKDEELTRQVIVEHESYGRLYRTGDLVKLSSGGGMMFVGRKDEQEKLYGCRVEISEVEEKLLENQEVSQALVMIHGNFLTNKKLIGYVGKKDIELDQWTARKLVSWTLLFDYWYEKEDKSNESTFIGWNNSFTGESFSKEEMQDWLEKTMPRLLKQEAENIWDNGCGEGLILDHYVRKKYVGKYRATDISEFALKHARKKISSYNSSMTRVLFEKCEASKFNPEDKQAYDLVILNSVIQYFPNADYLIEVLSGAVEAVRSGGSVFVGDVRNLDLLESFHLELALYKSLLDNVSYSDLRAFAQYGTLQERELVIKPKFFREFAVLNPRVSGVRIELKRGIYNNELTRYRYDVTLYVDQKHQVNNTVEFQDWSEKKTLDEVERQLVQSFDQLGFRKVPNIRFAKLKSLMRCDQESKKLQNLTEVYHSSSNRSSEMLDPEDFYLLGKKYNYEVIIDWSQEDPRCFDVIFTKNKHYCTLTPTLNDVLEGDKLRLESYINNPSRVMGFNDLSARLRQELEQTLPSFMVPAVIVVMDQLPINPNGKVARELLPSPMIYLGSIQKYSPPETETQKRMVEVWSDVLKLSPDQVGIHHDFFSNLSGNSIIIVQLLSVVNKEFSVDIDVTTFYRCSTIFKLSEQVEHFMRAMIEDRSQCMPDFV